MKTALIAGSTGLIGKDLLKLLLGSEQYSNVVALTRTKLADAHPKLRNIVFDFNSLSFLPPDIKPEDVFCCLGTTMAKAGSREKFYEVDFTYPFHLAKASHAAGAKKFLLVSALGSDKNSSVYYNKVKGELEEAIHSIQFETTHIFKPSLLLGSRAERRAGEEAAKAIFKVLGLLVPRKYKPIEAAKVARAMLEAASKNQTGFFNHESANMQQFKHS